MSTENHSENGWNHAGKNIPETDKPNNTEENMQEEEFRGGNSDEQKETYSFMNQVIKERPRNHKKLFHRIAAIVISGVLIGGIAAFSYVAFLPAAQKVLGTEEASGKITIPSDEDPGDVYVDTSSNSEIESAEGNDKGSESDSANSSSGGSVVSSTSSERETDTIAVDSDGDSASDTEEEQNSNSVEAETGQNEVSDGGTSEASTDTEGIDLTDTTTDEDQVDEDAAEASGANADSDSAYWGKSDITVYDYKLLYQDMMEMAEEPMQSVVVVTGISNELDYFNQNYVDTTQTSGLVIARNESDLFVLAEFKTISSAEKVQVTFYDNSSAEAQIVKKDENTGLCVLRVAQTALESEIPVANLGNSYTVQKGEPVLALGSPMGYSDAVAFGTVTSVSNKISLLDCEYNVLTTDIEGSSSGSGVLINLSGQVVGFISQDLGSGNSSTVTVLSISQIKELMQTLSNNEAIPYIGICGQNVTQEIADRTGIPVGLLVTEIAADSPAMLSGLKEYDVITSISGTEITTMRDYQKFLRNMKSGDVVTVTAMRQGADGYSEVHFSVTVGER